jgi:Glycosyl hydrolase family 12
MQKYVLPFLLGPVAAIACSTANPPPSNSVTPTGGTSGLGSGGTGTATGGTGGTGTTTGGTGGGTATGGTGGTGTTTGGTGGGTTTGGTGGTGPAAGGMGAVSQGGTGGTVSMSGAGGTAGAAMVTCSNTDKSILPIDSTGWVDKTCDACGIQGAFYWYADANTTPSLMCNGAACVAMTPPYQTTAPGPGMCISGKATGASADWGAGIGLTLNDSGGMNSVKNAFNATTAACGNVTGFDITLTGNTGGMPVRIGFTTDGAGVNIAPFIPVGDPAGTTLALSGATQIVIKNATIPTNWMSTDPSPPDPTAIYDLQIQVAADQATAGTPFDLCVTSIKPVIDGMESGGSGGMGGGTSCKQNSVGTISSNTGVQALGSSGLGYQNNVNNLGSGSQSVTGAYGTGCGELTVNTSGIKSNNDSPASYPSLVDGWHFGSWNGAYSQGSAKALSALSSVKSSFAFTPPAGNKWDVSYDMWVASSTGISAPDANTLEVMVWLDYSNAVTTNPIGSKLTTSLTAAGTTWEIWYGSTGAWHTVSYRRSPGSGAVTDLDLLAFLKDAVTHGTGSTSWDLLSVEAGFELFDATSGGSMDSYSCTIN